MQFRNVGHSVGKSVIQTGLDYCARVQDRLCSPVTPSGSGSGSYDYSNDACQRYRRNNPFLHPSDKLSCPPGEFYDIFRRLFLIENQPPFATNIRSSVRVKQAEKHHFVDPSLTCALLKATPSGLIGDLETLGFLFEALCERDLRIYAESFNGKLYHYQDYRNREIDAVIELENGSWCAFEIKLGANQIDSAAENLLSLQREISDEAGSIPPSVLCVICGLSSAAYQRADGVFVVPITALKN